MSQPGLDYYKVVESSNDLYRLIQVGSLNFHSLPTKKCALQGVSADENGWKWLDCDFLQDYHRGTFHPVFKALEFLIRHRYMSATFKVFQVSISSLVAPIAICKVRVYAIPLDLEGVRYVKQWRRKWLAQYLSRKFKSEWLVLFKVLDYSPEGWDGCDRLHCSISDFVKRSALVLPLTRSENYDDLFETNLSFHFGRWLDQLPYFVPSMKLDEESLESVVKKIYNSVSVPDLSYYQDKFVPKKLYLPNSEELIASLIKEYPSNRALIPGVTSTLYPFQLKSLCKMFEKETNVQKVPVSYFKRFASPTGRIYYFDMLNSGFYDKAELYTTPRGGILAENMGLGKTLICLSLICVTKFDISAIPDDVILHHDQSFNIEGPIDLTSSRNDLKPLSEICRNIIGQSSLPWKFYRDDLPLSVIEKLSGSPGFFRISLDYSSNQWGLRTKEKRHPHQLYQTLYLCNTTLLIVPENLFHQWNHELQKHIDPSYLEKLFVSDRFKTPIRNSHSSYVNQIPENARDLIKFDLVLITAPLFARMCQSENSNTLRGVYWKRLIIDEGHTMNSKSSNLSILCNSIYAERRWAVTGTPTSGLTNLYMDEEEKTQNANVQEIPSKKKRKYVVKSRFNVRDDLVKLGNLVGTYFKIEPFHSQPKLWNSAIVKNLSGSAFSTEASLRSLLDSLMVRHNLSQVESDLKLPQLHHEAVFLSPSYHNKLSINLFTAVLAVNAVSSEREGKDYMFDPSNRQQLRRLVNNLQLATFYWTGFQNDDVNTLISIAKHCMEKKNAQGELVYGKEDQKLLKLSISAAYEAVRNPRWRTASMLHEMQYFLDGVPNSFIKTLGIGILEDSATGIFGAPQLAAIQEFYYKNRFLDMKDEGILNAKLEAASGPFWENYWNDTVRKENSKFKKQDSSHDFDVHGLKQVLEDDVQEIGTKFTFSPSRKLSTSSQDWNSTRDSLKRLDGGGLKITDEAIKNASKVSGVDVKETTILGSASTKLSYLASRLVDHQKEGIKSIIFFEFEDSAYYLTELLDILGVNYILYATFIGAGQRSNNLADFDSHNSSSYGGTTLIMDLRLASHGLTIISATRVYFLSPVWQRSVEAQAIKRAHRIGQTKEVFVETLVLQGTLEEEIYRRREQDEPQQEKSDTSRRYVIDDTGMQQFILRHQFLSTDKNETEFASFSALDLDQNSKVKELPPEDNLDSLIDHKSRRELRQLQWYKHWNMYLFNPDNIQKLNSAKRQKANIDQLNSELVKGKPEWPSISHVESRSRKRVRF